ncbi:polymer-forming cytoskeletal protein [Deinococcus arenicola]|uniref:Polymer-forming cytoskeletal protein n=1 Tax=Deinococcus arenicola TaxID=2994950 RepID=A0ABU4DTB2_9DEIO|nr:polymer-forming cytoskeletal protein [Deinococcus sp. ZS9-10]MDV6375613.1 polymer-forming cytoskeletal protein [Deinococcus sp. ZS9-10]
MERHKRQGRSDADLSALLDLLHREADGDLISSEMEALYSLPDQADIARQRLRLAATTAHLSALPPPGLPASCAPQVAAEVAWSLRLEIARPELPYSLAGAVLADIAAARHLQTQSVPSLPHSLASEVVSEIWVARQLALPAMSSSVAAAVASEIAWSGRVQMPAPPLPRSVAGAMVARMSQPEGESVSPPPPSFAPVSPMASGFLLPIKPRHNPAPLALVVALMVGLTLLAVTTVWPNLAAGALVLQTLLAQVSPLAGVGLALLLLTSALVSWRPGPAMQRLGAGAFALSAVLTLPALYSLAAHGDVRFGQNIVVSGPVDGNVIAVGGHVRLEAGARVRGEVVTLLGDVRRDPGAQVSGRVNALLGHAPDDLDALETAPPQGLGMATAAAFRPLLGWLGGAAWPQIFVTLTGGALLLLFVAGLAPTLARRQRQAPMRTLALGVLALTALGGPALALALAGLLGPALVAAALAVVIVAVGLSVSAYDLGRTLARRLRLPVPDAVGALLGLSAVAASLSEPPLAFGLALIGGAWGAGTLLLARGGVRVG